MDYSECHPLTIDGAHGGAASSSYLDDPDVRLMLQAKDGDGSAFTELQARYAPRVFGYFVRLMHDRATAEDLTQDVFLRLYRSRTNYHPRARFTTWIYHISQNVARNALRTRIRRPTSPLANASPAEGRLVDRNEPSTPVERDEMVSLVRAAVAGLTRRHRSAIEMHLFQGRTCAEVGAELGMTTKAVKSMLYRARMQLRDVLAPVVG